MLNGIKCEPCNGTGMTTVFDAQAVMRAMSYLQRDNLIQAVKALREYTSGEVSLKAAVDYAREVMKPELEAIRKLEKQESGEAHNEWAARMRGEWAVDAYGSGGMDYRDQNVECDCIENTCNECMPCSDCSDPTPHPVREHDGYNPATNKAVFQ